MIGGGTALTYTLAAGLSRVHAGPARIGLSSAKPRAGASSL
jgi:hypothetical protein